MSLIAIVLILLSAFMHVGWNLLSKRQHPSASFFLIASIAGALLFAPALVLYRDTLLHHVPGRVWILLGSTGFFMALYYTALGGAYRAGDMSIAYPLARSTPVIFVAIVTLLLGRGHQVSSMCFAGSVLVVVGCFLIPLQRFSDFHWKRYLNLTCGLALLTAVGTTGYSLIDDAALRILRTPGQTTISNTQVTLLYACLQALVVSLWLAVFIALRRDSRQRLKQNLHTSTKHAILAGVIINLTYALVLIAMAFADNVSYVVGFRQLSIPLGAVVGILVLKEASPAPKLTGVAVMFVGLVLVAVG